MGVMLTQPLADLLTTCLCAFLCVHTLKSLNELSNAEETENELLEESLQI